MQSSAGEAEPGEGDQAAAAPELTNAQVINMGLQMVRETLCGVANVTSPKRTLTDQTCEVIGEANGPLLDKWGISLSGMGGGYMVELKAAFVTLPILWAAWLALKEEMRAMRAKPIVEEPEIVNANVA